MNSEYLNGDKVTIKRKIPINNMFNGQIGTVINRKIDKITGYELWNVEANGLDAGWYSITEIERL